MILKNFKRDAIYKPFPLKIVITLNAILFISNLYAELLDK